VRLHLFWVALVLTACRSEALPPPDLLPAPRDFAVVDQSVPDLPLVDLAGVDGEAICAPEHPMGYCPPGSSCCPYSCWGSGPAPYIWCAPSLGCPVC
jgi:hypothetical protein